MSTIWSNDDSKPEVMLLNLEKSKPHRYSKYSICAAVFGAASVLLAIGLIMGINAGKVDKSQSVKATDLTNQDFVNLKNALKQYVMQDPTSHVRKLVRLSFHDLAAITSTNSLGPNGCIQSQEIQSLPGNEGLSQEISQLSAFVSSRFPNTPFSFGDVISLAGKVAIEIAYPCMNIPWKFGRSTCSSTANPGDVPLGQISTVAEITPFLDRYGLSQNEMAILLAGAHGITGANTEVQNSGFGLVNTVFAEVNSGLDWIRITVGPWGSLIAPNGFLQFIDLNILRLPVDFLFFPIVADNSGGRGDPAAAPVEAFMRSFLSQPRSVFDAEFETVYAKMLEIGTANDQLQVFADPDGKSAVCPLNFPPATPLPPVQVPTTSIVQVFPSTTATTTTFSAPTMSIDQVVPSTTVTTTSVSAPNASDIANPKTIDSDPGSAGSSPTVLVNSAVANSVLFSFFSMISLIL